MADRTVKVKLVADVSDYTAGLVKAAAATRGLAGDVEKNIDRDMSPAMRRAGERQGGLLARGINNGLMRNSPLIAAAIGGALIAGAPVALAGAGVLFAGIGALSAAQNSAMRDDWMSLGHDIRDGAVSDAAILGDSFSRAADQIGASFQRMRPELRDAFEAAAPQIERFTEGLTKAAENAMPGLVRAVERGGPVIDGLAELMGDLGTGLSDFFDAMSSHSPAAGNALASLGDAMGNLLPLLGEVLGQGAELAQDVLPLVSGSLGMLLGVTRALGPALPIVGAGLLGFKVANTAAGWVGGLGSKLLDVSEQGGLAATAAGRVGGVLTTVGRAAPLIGIGVGLVGMAFERSAEQLRQFSQVAEDAYTKLRMGGSEAVKAAAQIKVMEEAAANVGDGFGTFGSEIPDRLRDAKNAAEEAARSMTDVDRATQGVATAQANLALAVGKYGPTSSQAATASAALTGAQNALAGAQDRVRLATDGVTQAMLDQAAVALAAANSSLAYRMAADATEDAVAALTAAQASGTATADQLDDASMAVEQAMLRQAEAARQAAFDTSTASSEAGKNAEADAAMLAQLLMLRDTMGSSFPAALNTTIARLQGSTNAGMVAAAQFQQLGLNVLSVPNSKTIIVSSTTPEQIKLLESLGFKVRTLPDGTVEVTAHTDAAETAINQAARDRQSTIYVRTVGGNQTVPGSSIRSTVATGGAIENGRVQHFLGGGAVRGPGGPKADQVPAMLSNGEHVWNAAEVQAAGGQAAMAAMRRAVMSGREVSGGWAAGGGAVSVNITGAQIVGTLDLGEGIAARIDGRIVSALTGATNRGGYNG